MRSQNATQKTPESTPLPQFTATPSATITPRPTSTLTTTSTPILPTSNRGSQPGWIIVSLPDGLYRHLFILQPGSASFLRLTDSPWDDIHPAVNPDGTKIAYSSRKTGFWDIYILDLKSSTISQITNSPEYDGAPSWSPDGQWLAYESYQQNNLDIFLRPAVQSEDPPIRLTDNPGVDHSPAWSPKGRVVAYCTYQSGESRVMLAYLDRLENRYVQVNKSKGVDESSPAWSPDGELLAWSSLVDGIPAIQVWSPDKNDPPRQFGFGGKIAWSPDGNTILTQLNTPGKPGLTALSIQNGAVVLPYINLPGDPDGFSWIGAQATEFLQVLLSRIDQKPAPPLFQVILSNYPVLPAGRFGIIKLDQTIAPYPYLHDAVNESFFKLRERVGVLTGWDALANLENAYIPLTVPPSPGIAQDWHYTGRAISLNYLFISAGWMSISKEELNGLTYWRLYLRARVQDGSMGKPLTQAAWDLNSRFSGDPRSYEMGGAPGEIPAGYWIDFTELAARYQWERLASLVNWRTYFPAIKFNQFVFRAGLDWMSAMSEIYPPEALAAATPIPTATLFPSKTPTPRGFIATPTPGQSD